MVHSMDTMCPGSALSGRRVDTSLWLWRMSWVTTGKDLCPPSGPGQPQPPLGVLPADFQSQVHSMVLVYHMSSGHNWHCGPGEIVPSPALSIHSPLWRPGCSLKNIF